jgi:hypothetical protein
MGTQTSSIEQILCLHESRKEDDQRHKQAQAQHQEMRLHHV